MAAEDFNGKCSQPSKTERQGPLLPYPLPLSSPSPAPLPSPPPKVQAQKEQEKQNRLSSAFPILLESSGFSRQLPSLLGSPWGRAGVGKLGKA